jgi:PAS domain S-box-containing protein
MPIFEGGSRNDVLADLQRVLGVHKWTVNLDTGMMRVEYGRAFGKTHLHELSVAELASLLGPEDMRLYHAHWDMAARAGHHGPVNLPFANAAGEKSVVESACALYLSGGERFLIGVFKRINQRAELSRNARLLAEFLESFIAHSPSGIVVVDSQGKVVSANREFIRFVGKASRTEVVKASVLDMVYAVSTGLGHVMREALRSASPTRGRYEATFENGTRQTLYWRAFPLSMDATTIPPHVFAFDLNEQGARSAAA